ncbi:MAG: U32 family peptidase C-terminal domain-containing protein [Sphaerochaetaceae bacterium]|nr:U32 family peptidase C-terminal domain-containing protein [Sphaerochaetaceae bacterium]MDC7238427.1 U32 family peptidase C-terminal domain-containing protein [Sphaerochaetaceae bacterium]
MVELLSPAGDIRKLKTAFTFGADAAYMGLPKFSLRANAKNIDLDQKQDLIDIKKQFGNKKLYCAINIIFHEDQINDLKEQVKELKSWPFDAYIVTDIGAMEIIKNEMPDKEVHLSTQASCINSAAAKLYNKIGFSRIILGREASIKDIKKIKQAAPELEIETFVHGAMCMAYSGRCLLSSYFSSRSANQGDCAHSCRWNYKLMANKGLEDVLASDTLALEEYERPNEYYPISEEDGFTTILSSKDLCMIDHVDKLIDAGVTSLKIEGRMKSLYYNAVATRAYRKAIDKDPLLSEYRKDLFNISHRKYSTGFFFDKTDEDNISEPTIDGYERNYLFIGIINKEVKKGIWDLDVRFQVKKGQTIEYIGKDVLNIVDSDYTLLNSDFEEIDQIDHGKVQYLKTDKPIEEGYIIRRLNNGEIKSTRVLNKDRT